MTASRRFTLERSAGDLTLEVKGGSRAARITGVTLASIGAPLLVTGLVLLPITSFDSTRRMAAGFAVTGGISVAVGIPLLLIGRTVVQQRKGRPSR